MTKQGATCAPLTKQHRAKLASEDSITFAGWHQWQTVTDDPEWGTVFHGSFEVFYENGEDAAMFRTQQGWYWWACWPGYLPDGEASGPFKTAEQAYLDAKINDLARASQWAVEEVA